MIYNDPFLGDIELEKLITITKNMVGETVVETIYDDNRGNYYIQTLHVEDSKSSMYRLRKEVVDAIAVANRKKSSLREGKSITNTKPSPKSPKPKIKPSPQKPL